MSTRAAKAGVVLRAEGALCFLPAAVAQRISPAPRVTEVPGAPPALLGVAIHEGAVVPVLSIGLVRTEMVVCLCAGERVGVVGARVVRSGTFDAAPDGSDAVEFEGATVPALDLAKLVAQVQIAGRPTLLGS